MKNSEEAIEKVLAGLRDAEAPAGMERRILCALEDQESVRTRLGWRWLRPIWLVMTLRPVVTKSVVCGVALAGLFAIVVAIPAFRRQGHVPGHSHAGGQIDSPSAGTRPLASSETAAVSAPLSPSRPGMRSVRKTSVKGEEEGVVRGGDRDGVDDSDSVAVSEMRAPSYPAPPLPLTEQERLLLRIVHKDGPVELAMLDARLRTARDEEDKAEVQRFFVQPKTVQDGTEQGAAATDPVSEKRREGQEQIPSGDDGKKVDDNGSRSGSPSDPSSAPEEPKTGPSTPVPATAMQEVPQKVITGENE